MKKLLTLFVAALTLLTLSVPALAHEVIEGQGSPRFIIIDDVSSGAFEQSGEIVGTAKLRALNDASLKITISIHEKSGSSWTLLTTDSDTAYGTSLKFNLSAPCSAGNEYKVLAKFKAGTETDSITTIITT